MALSDIHKEQVSEMVKSKIFITEDEALKVLGIDLPLLAKHFDRHILDGLRKGNEWLTWLEDDPVTHWDDLRKQFLEHGLKCLDILDSFTTALRCHIINELMIASNVGAFHGLAMFLINRYLKNAAKRGISKHYIDIGCGEKDRSVLLEKMRKEIRTADEDEKNDPGIGRLREISKGTIIIDSHGSKYSNLAAVCHCLRLIYKDYSVTSISDKPMERPLKDNLNDLKRTLETKSVVFKESHLYETYSENVKQFVRQVGCAKAWETPEENVAELRLFYSTTIGFVAKLQDNYLKKELEIKELNRTVVALEFRYLLEHLPDPTSAGDGAGGRWMNFWENALQNEADHYLNQNSFPNKHLVEVMESYNPGRVDRRTKVINKEYQKGYLFRKGKDLYNDLSNEIHRYRGKGYEIGDDLALTKAIQDVLQALKPEKYEDGEVKWVEERKRYFP